MSVGDTGLPFAPYTEILRSLVAEDGVATVTAMAGWGAEDLARIVPVLGDDAVTYDHELWAQARMYAAILGLLRRYAEHRSMVLQLEDLHWADAGTLAATTFLLRNITDKPILIVATYREDEVVRTHPLRAWLAEALRLEWVERLVLDRLDVDEVTELVANITGEPPDAELAATISQRTDGNPYFEEELIARGAAAALGSQPEGCALRPDVSFAQCDLRERHGSADTPVGERSLACGGPNPMAAAAPSAGALGSVRRLRRVRRPGFHRVHSPT